MRMSSIKVLLLILIAAIGFRLFTLDTLPYLDRTEARTVLAAYMSFESSEPFRMQLMRNEAVVSNWSKPPLYYWLVQISFRIFGSNEFAARVPAFLSGLLCIICIMWVVRWKEASLIAASVLITSGLFFFLMGLSLLDMTLAAAVTASLSFMLRGVEEREYAGSRIWMMLSGFFCGLGMLTKGPVAPALILLTVVLFCLRRRRRELVWRLPWTTWLNACLLTTVPAFIFIEYHNPGFLRYFFINENLLRYTSANYGDLYGEGHRRAYGTSWFYLFISFLPWTPLLIYFIWARMRGGMKISVREEGDEIQDRREFLLCWGLAPAIFFTLARQHLASYMLPGLPGLAAYIALELSSVSLPAVPRFENMMKKAFTYSSSIAGIALISAGLFVAGSWGSASVSVALFFLLIIGLQRLARSGNLYGIFSGCAFATAVTLSIGVISFSPYCGRFASTRDVLEYIRHDLRFEGKVEFPFEVPNSAYLYSEGFAGSLREDGNGCGKSALCIARIKDLSPVPGRRIEPLEIITQMGKWVVFRKLAPPISLKKQFVI